MSKHCQKIAVYIVVYRKELKQKIPDVHIILLCMETEHSVVRITLRLTSCMQIKYIIIASEQGYNYKNASV